MFVLCIHLILFPILIRSGRIPLSSIWDLFKWSLVYLGLHVLFCSYKWRKILCLIFDFLIHPNSNVNRTAEVIAIFNRSFVRSFRHLRLLYLNELFSQPNQSIRELLKRSVRSQILSILSLFIFHDSSNELAVNF